MKRVVGLGLTVYDITLPLEEMFVEDAKMRIHNKYEGFGGQATCAACVCAKWGLDTMMISRVGNDTYGNKAVNDLKTLGMNTDYMKVLDHYETSLSIIINHLYNGHRTILNQQDKVTDIKFDIPDQVDGILLDGHELQAGLDLLEKHKDAIVVLDAEKVNDITLTFAKYADWIVCSEKFAKDYCHVDEITEENWTDIFKNIQKLNNKNVIITIGERGCLYEKDGMIINKKGYKVNAIDTVGAGDIFHGTFLYGLLNDMDLVDILQLCNATCALSVQRIGGYTSIPTLEEVETFIQEMK